MSIDQLKGRAQIDHLKVLAAIVRKYGDSGLVVITPDDLRPKKKGGLRREIDQETGNISYWFEEND